ncbi:MAG: MBL fold metallo-hydrolase [Deltaproteobacteria bacterium]|nr:MBL fold metallo-hydrolase [Deltaproteobacteria bacterium]
MSFSFRWLGTACFEIRLDSGETLILDPYMDDAFNCPLGSDDIERADLICLTHGHFDHVLDVGRLAHRLGSTVICSDQVARNMMKRFDIPAHQIIEAAPGEIFLRNSFGIEVVKGTHVDNRAYFAEQMGLDSPETISDDEMVRKFFEMLPDESYREQFLSYMGKYPPGRQLNFILHMPGNLRCYVFGSAPDPELFSIAEASRAQVLFLQILKDRELGAVDAARRVGASVVVPSHHDAFIPGQSVPDVEKVREQIDVEPGMSFLDPEAGKWYEIGLNAEAV